MRRLEAESHGRAPMRRRLEAESHGRAPMRRRLAAAAAAVALGGGVLGGCGSSSPGMSPSASAALAASVSQVQVAASSDNRALAAARLDALVAQVGDLLSRGQLSASKARAILAAAGEVRAQLVDLPTPTTTTSTTTTTLAPAREPAPKAPAPPHHGGHGDH